MRKINSDFRVFLVILCMMIFTFSCKKDNKAELSKDVSQSALDDAITYNIDDDIFTEVDDVDLTEYDFNKNTGADCPTINAVINQSTDTITVEVDYGAGCTCIIRNRERTKSGKIIIKRNNTDKERFEDGVIRVVTFENFYIDSVKIEGIVTIESQGLSNDLTSVTYNVVSQGGKLTFPDNTVVEYNVNHNRVYYFGGLTSLTDYTDDYFRINGTSQGVNYLGQNFSRVLNNITFIYGCLWPVIGTVVVTNSEIGNFTVDFGNGECDLSAKVLYGGESYGLTLLYRLRRTAQ